MKTNGGFLVTKIKQLGDRIFERIPRKADLQLLHLRPCLSGWKKTD